MATALAMALPPLTVLQSLAPKAYLVVDNFVNGDTPLPRDPTFADVQRRLATSHAAVVRAAWSDERLNVLATEMERTLAFLYARRGLTLPDLHKHVVLNALHAIHMAVSAHGAIDVLTLATNFCELIHRISAILISKGRYIEAAEAVQGLATVAPHARETDFYD